MTIHNVLSGNGNANHRRQRAQLACIIADLLKDDAAHDLDGEDWDVLDALPGWTNLADASLRRLVLIAGALLLQPQFRQSINGALLRQAVVLLSQVSFREILNAELPDSTSGIELSPKMLEQALENAGISVLLASVCCPSYRAVLQSRLLAIVNKESDCEPVHLRSDVAHLLLDKAEAISMLPPLEKLV